MKDELARKKIAEQLDRLLASAKEPRVLRLQENDRTALEHALTRAQAHLLGSPEPILIVALAGGTGTGKSSLINALAGSKIAEVSVLRPTTQHPCVYHHQDVTADRLPQAMTSAAFLVPHDRPELRTKVLVDTPDLDSFVIAHRALTKTLLKAAGLILYVFSPEKYLEERTWSVLREEHGFSASVAILNKVDQVASPEELELITTDLRKRFANIGLGHIRIFRTCAATHVPSQTGTLPSLQGHTPDPFNLDDTAALRAFLERELQASDVARMRRAQQERVVAHLRDVVERCAPPDTLMRLDEVVTLISQQEEAAADRLTEQLSDRLAEAERELAPLVTLRQHERFWGPFRTWLVVTDFLRFRLAGATRQLLDGSRSYAGGVVEHLLLRGGTLVVDTLLREEAATIQDLLYARDLPIAHWRSITAHPTGSHFLSQVATEVAAHFETATTAVLKQGRVLVWLASVFGSLAPAGLVSVGLYILGRDFLEGQYVGFPLLGHLFAMVILFFLTLQGLSSLFLPGTRRLGRGIGRQAVRVALTRTRAGWLDAYRADLEADLQDFHEPFQVLQSIPQTQNSLSLCKHQ